MSNFKKNPIATDKDYFKLADYVYDDRYLHKGEKIKGNNGNVWRVIESINTDRQKVKNGLQAIAVVPAEEYKENKLHYENITFVFRGTEFGKFDGDLTADTNQVFLGNQKNLQVKRNGVYPTQLEKSNKETQFDTAINWVDEVNEKYQPTFVHATGHSLGAGLAQYVATERNFYATTYAAPNIYRLLSPEAKKRADSGEMDHKVVDYTHRKDAVGNFAQFGAPIIGKQYTVKGNGNLDKILAVVFMGEHPMNTFEGMFHSNGSVQLKFEPEEIIRQARDIQAISDKLLDIARNIEEFQRREEEAIMELKRKLKHETGSGGKYHLLSEHDVDKAIAEIAKARRNGRDYFYDVDLAEELIYLLRKEQRDLGYLGEDIAYAAKSLRDKDNELATNFTGLVRR
ncbi:lipase family protein [Bacillus sp. GB_SG_008]|uniref:lipase family protein n=1 Tax=Bacillus sp. GB_SG_008 TaxID=3454627 RepID=UPI003F84A7F9